MSSGRSSVTCIAPHFTADVTPRHKWSPALCAGNAMSQQRCGREGGGYKSRPLERPPSRPHIARDAAVPARRGCEEIAVLWKSRGCRRIDA